LLNALSGVMRPTARLRSPGPDLPAVEPAVPATKRRLHRRAIGVARFLADSLTATPRARQRAVAVIRGQAHTKPQPARATTRRRLHRRHVLLRLTADRAIPISVALVVLMAAGVSLAPAAAPVGAVQAEAAAAQGGVRLTIGGASGPNEFDGPVNGDALAAAGAPVDDGTLYKPVAVDTSVASSAGMLQHYTVRDNDTLTSIASRFGLSVMTIWWANHMTSKDSLKAGEVLVIPPVNGLVITVKAGDTLDSLAAANKISVDDIVAVNRLTDTNLIVGQVLVLPGAKGAPMPTPTTAPKAFGGSAGGTGPAPRVSGSWAWPVVGGGNYISQYFHYGHYGVDIAADYGTPIVAPLAAHVIFAGWKDNGGGYQVWLQLGSGLYSAEYHMSAVLVAAGQDVAKGQRVGRIGMSGWASGPHCHFEVWVGYPWESGSYRVNPLRYY
jgi:murein DD-endopeptidase MepM/ murein hydrolase activator NlpD